MFPQDTNKTNSLFVWNVNSAVCTNIHVGMLNDTLSK